MVDVLDLLAFIAENMGKGEAIDRIKETLLQKGYTENEINVAFHYLLFSSRAHQGEHESPARTRILHPVEQTLVSPEAYGHLLKLRMLNIIDDVQLERIIEEALLVAEDVVRIEEVKRAAYKVLFHPKEADHPLLLPGKDEGNLPIH